MPVELGGFALTHPPQSGEYPAGHWATRKCSQTAMPYAPLVSLPDVQRYDAGEVVVETQLLPCLVPFAHVGVPTLPTQEPKILIPVVQRA